MLGDDARTLIVLIGPLGPRGDDRHVMRYRTMPDHCHLRRAAKLLDRQIFTSAQPLADRCHRCFRCSHAATNSLELVGCLSTTTEIKRCSIGAHFDARTAE